MLRATTPAFTRAAVVLAGSGVYDGTEITEAVALLAALSRRGVDVTCYAPDRPQAHVVNHVTGEEMGEARNVKVEAARIARGAVESLDTLKAVDHDVLFIPGGFGAAKNLSDFGFKGADMTVADDVAAVLRAFHDHQKYIGLCCIAPVLAAKVFGTASGGPGAKLTLGARGDAWPYAGAIDAAASFGNTMEECGLDAVAVDEDRRIITAPAYMRGDAKPHEVVDSVDKMVAEVLKRL